MAEDQMTVIGPDTHIKGEMSFDTSCRLLGRFEGTINAKGQFHIADGANCKATVQAGNITVDGSVEGNVSASDKVQLNAKAKVVGDVTAAKLVVAEGASFVGHVQVGAAAAKAGRGQVEIETTGAAKQAAGAK